METVRGIISSIQVYEEEGGHDWFLTLSKAGWGVIWFLFPISLFRFLNDFFGIAIAIAGMIFLAIVVRLVGPHNLVMLDELLCRLFPFFRSAVRLGRIRIYDFRLRTAEGRMLACLLKGNLEGAAPVIGDSVVLEGRQRSGTFRIRRGFNEETGSILATRSVPSFWIFLGTVILMTVIILHILGLFDEVIMKVIEYFLVSGE
ncbi:MAG: hypothetical protein FJ123_00930 [Deltaproteobacteria bacterium]|nr:hypothetical protein [Deltaproteobacteria bacterium]